MDWWIGFICWMFWVIWVTYKIERLDKREREREEEKGLVELENDPQLVSRILKKIGYK